MSAITKMHFQAAADIVKGLKGKPRDQQLMLSNEPISEIERGLVADCFVELFKQFNDKFDTKKFYQACDFQGRK